MAETSDIPDHIVRTIGQLTAIITDSTAPNVTRGYAMRDLARLCERHCPHLELVVTERQTFAEALERLGTESVISLDEMNATAPTRDTHNNEAGTR
jgi:hypothetical protein